MPDRFLEYIDWLNHDGVNLPMINDFVRNQFYDRIISAHVRDQECIDIGFGTGLLSMMALRHGAKHILAFESDPDRYALGQHVIKELKLEQQIELVNIRYDRSYQHDRVVFTETVNGNLWWEGLWNSLPEHSHTVFLPGQYFLEIWAVTVPERFAQGLCRQRKTDLAFDPAVDIDPSFVSLINKLRGCAVPEQQSLPEGIVKFERQQDTDWGWIPYMRAVQAGSVVGGYTALRWDPERTEFAVSIDTSAWKDCTALIVPRMGMAHGKEKLYLDNGHWGPGEDPILLNKPKNNLLVTHNVNNGVITYSLQ